jgi:hypothetical protein
MARYFFDIDDGDRSSLDEDGLELSGPWEARFNAIAVLPDIAREVLPNGRHRELVTTVRDDRGTALFKAKLTLDAGWLVPAPPK